MLGLPTHGLGTDGRALRGAVEDHRQDLSVVRSGMMEGKRLLALSHYAD